MKRDFEKVKAKVHGKYQKQVQEIKDKYQIRIEKLQRYNLNLQKQIDELSAREFFQTDMTRPSSNNVFYSNTNFHSPDLKLERARSSNAFYRKQNNNQNIANQQIAQIKDSYNHKIKMLREQHLRDNSRLQKQIQQLQDKVAHWTNTTKDFLKEIPTEQTSIPNSQPSDEDSIKIDNIIFSAALKLEQQRVNFLQSELNTKESQLEQMKKERDSQNSSRVTPVESYSQLIHDKIAEIEQLRNEILKQKTQYEEKIQYLQSQIQYLQANEKSLTNQLTLANLNLSNEIQKIADLQVQHEEELGNLSFDYEGKIKTLIQQKSQDKIAIKELQQQLEGIGRFGAGLQEDKEVQVYVKFSVQIGIGIMIQGKRKEFDAESQTEDGITQDFERQQVQIHELKQKLHKTQTEFHHISESSSSSIYQLQTELNNQVQENNTLTSQLETLQQNLIEAQEELQNRENQIKDQHDYINKQDFKINQLKIEMQNIMNKLSLYRSKHPNFRSKDLDEEPIASDNMVVGKFLIDGRFWLLQKDDLDAYDWIEESWVSGGLYDVDSYLAFFQYLRQFLQLDVSDVELIEKVQQILSSKDNTEFEQIFLQKDIEKARAHIDELEQRNQKLKAKLKMYKELASSLQKKLDDKQEYTANLIQGMLKMLPPLYNDAEKSINIVMMILEFDEQIIANINTARQALKGNKAKGLQKQLQHNKL